MLKKAIFIIYPAVIMTMAAATVIEKERGTDFVASAIYGSWWFTVLWAVLAAAGGIYIIRCKMKRRILPVLHGSFVIILLGALLTHMTAWQGTLHLRMNKADSSLPFTITLTEFNVLYHEGTTAPYDYISHFTITDGGKRIQGMVSMNNIYSYRGYRLYQSAYDEDMKGSILSVNSDPWGIPITYFGYALLFISLLWMLADPNGRFRKTMSKTARPLAAMVALTMAATAPAANTLDRADAERLARLNINYNDRICPLETFALDFTKTVTGSRSHGSHNATQVLAGFMLFGNEWMKEPLVKVGSKELRQRLNITEEYVPAASFFTDNGMYRLGPYVQEYYRGNSDAFHKAVADVDNRLMLIMQVRRMAMLKIFPYKGKWYAPADSLPQSMDTEQQAYVHNAIPVLAMLVRAHDTASTSEMLDKMLKYQYRYGGETIPPQTRLTAERLYNALPYTTILFMVCLSLAVLSILFPRLPHHWGAGLCLVALSAVLALRWTASGRIPLANGYETMLTMAWAVLLVATLLYRRFKVIITFGMLLAGFFLLVSHLSQMNPQINHLMPVLQSPLLTIHVSIIMMSYALLSITAACGVVALVSRKQTEAMTQLSVLMLYPAMACLGIGIFVGAVWANVSWGTYWSWDPKETWALITFMLYAIPLHSVSLPSFRKPRTYHIFMLTAFVSVIITYFGVNYLLGGMHSYA